MPEGSVYLYSIYMCHKVVPTVQGQRSIVCGHMDPLGMNPKQPQSHSAGRNCVPYYLHVLVEALIIRLGFEGGVLYYNIPRGSKVATMEPMGKIILRNSQNPIL